MRPVYVPPLTAAEREVIVLAARGMTNREIAAALSVTLNTVKSHLKSVFMKLGVQDRRSAAYYATGNAPTRTPVPVPEGPPLTDREREVLAYAAGGMTNREIAATLGVTRETVKSHLWHIYQKLGAHSRQTAVEAATTYAVTANADAAVAPLNLAPL